MESKLTYQNNMIDTGKKETIGLLDMAIQIEYGAPEEVYNEAVKILVGRLKVFDDFGNTVYE